MFSLLGTDIFAKFLETVLYRYCKYINQNDNILIAKLRFLDHAEVELKLGKFLIDFYLC